MLVSLPANSMSAWTLRAPEKTVGAVVEPFLNQEGLPTLMVGYDLMDAWEHRASCQRQRFGLDLNKNSAGERDRLQPWKQTNSWTWQHFPEAATIAAHQRQQVQADRLRASCLVLLSRHRHQEQDLPPQHSPHVRQ